MYTGVVIAVAMYIPLQLNSLKVADLKEYLKSVGLKTSGKKQDLIDTITKHVNG